MNSRGGVIVQRCIAAILVTVCLAAWPPPVSAQGAPFCRPGESPSFTFGFAVLKDQLGPIMGSPVECAHPNSANGDVLQNTTTGLSFWRKSTNTPTFTDGHRHWALTPSGMVAWTGSSIDPPGTATVPSASSSGDMSLFIGDWGKHGFGLTISPSGRGDAEWRIYTWCNQTGGREPCDRIVNNIIIGGGRAFMEFSPPGQGGSDGTTLHGRITHSTDLPAMPIGPVVLRLGPYGTAQLQAGPEIYTLCGPRYLSEAPEWFKRTLPCGA